jgi:hypothetical protein
VGQGEPVGGPSYSLCATASFSLWTGQHTPDRVSNREAPGAELQCYAAALVRSATERWVMTTVDSPSTCLVGITSSRLNGRAYELFFEIENSLREMVIQCMTEAFGQRWLTTNMPADVRERLREGKEYERKVPWSVCVPYHPMYYADFPDIKKIVMRADNWQRAFAPRFGSKLQLEASLVELEPIRNKLAHCRAVTDIEVRCILVFHEKLATMIGTPLSNFIEQGLIRYRSVLQQLREMSQMLREGCNDLRNTRPYERLASLHDLRSLWWFDEVYLCNHVGRIERAIDLIQLYNQLPIGRGTGHIREKWVKDHDALCYLKAAIEDAERIVHLASQ